MSIVWDALLTRAAALALHRRLVRGRLRALRIDHEADSLLLWFREATVVLRLHPGRGSLLVLDPEEPTEDARPLAATLFGVEAPPDDRLILFHMRKLRGRTDPWLVAVELITNRWNAVICEGDDRRIRHLLHEREGDRPLRVGGVWTPPEPTGREGRDGDLSPARWREILAPHPPDERRGPLLRNVAWTSGLNAPHLLEPSGTSEEPEEPGEEGDARRGTASDEERLELGHARWRALVEPVLEPPGGPDDPPFPDAVLLEGRDGLQPYPVPLPDVDGEAAGGLLDAFLVAARQGGGRALSAIPSAWVKALETRADRARGRIRGLTRELEGAEDPEVLRRKGDLLLARFGEVPRGAERVTLEDFQGSEVTVELDPSLDPQQNAAAWYDRAGRAERALEKLPGMIEEARDEAARLEALLERVRAGEATPEEVREELPASGGDGGGGDDGASLPYRTYRSSGGLEIRVGKGARRNDDLTFHHSRPEDVWMHARHAAGAHVILRWDQEGNPPRQDLGEAAVLAALHSKARTSGSVPVDWTRRKYVRKPRKAPPGAVVPDRIETVFVTPDPEVEARLQEEG